MTQAAEEQQEGENYDAFHGNTFVPGESSYAQGIEYSTFHLSPMGCFPHWRETTEWPVLPMCGQLSSPAKRSSCETTSTIVARTQARDGKAYVLRAI